MQYKKKHVKDSILQSGKDEFLKLGYKAANIASIAANANVPVGNLYRYFDGKKGLLEAIVEPIYTSLPQTILSMANFDISENELILDELLSKIAKDIYHILAQYGSEFLILADKCESTKYEKFSDELTDFVTNIILTKLYLSEDADNEFMARLISKAFINSIFDVLRMKLSIEKMEDMLLRIIRFYFFAADTRK